METRVGVGPGLGEIRDDETLVALNYGTDIRISGLAGYLLLLLWLW